MTDRATPAGQWGPLPQDRRRGAGGPAILGAGPEGITPEALGAELGKSTATARYLLNTLCQEGYAVRERQAGTVRLHESPPWGETWGGRRSPDDLSRYELPERLSDAVTELVLAHSAAHLPRPLG